jgi:hypothetical protein
MAQVSLGAAVMVFISVVGSVPDDMKPLVAGISLLILAARRTW